MADKPIKTDPSSAEEAAAQRGHMLKKWGEEAGSTDPMNDAILARWTLDNPNLDVQCDAQVSQPATNGHYVSLDANVEASPDLSKGHTGDFDITYGWSYYLADGTKFNGHVDSGDYGAFSCLQESETITSVGPGEKATGKVVFDLPSTDGTLVFESDGLGWEYPLNQ